MVLQWQRTVENPCTADQLDAFKGTISSLNTNFIKFVVPPMIGNKHGDKV